MTEPTSCNPPEPKLDFDAWKCAMDLFREGCGLPEACLNGWSVRVRHSSWQEPYRSLGQAFEKMLRDVGAKLRTLDDIDHALASTLQPRQLDSVDTFLMIAGTASVSAEAMELSHELTKEGTRFSGRTFVTLPKELRDGFIRKRLEHHRVTLDVYGKEDAANGRLCARVLGKIIEQKRQVEMLNDKKNPKIGILTALPIELDAMVSQLQGADRKVERVDEVLRDYVYGTLPARNGGNHEIVVVRTGVGTNISAALAERLFRDFDLDEVIMVGIAGGIPQVNPRQDDVRLGDVVVSGRKGVVQYDLIKKKVRSEQPAHNPMPPSRAWTTLAESMPSDPGAMTAFNSRLEEAQKQMEYRRPPAGADVLKDDSDPKNPKTIRRKRDPRREQYKSLAFIGSVGSANRVVKSHRERERIREKYGVIAVEMEAAGVAEAAMSNGRPFFVVRGVCDYANHGKNDRWHGYAAMAAATFAATLIEAMPLKVTEA